MIAGNFGLLVCVAMVRLGWLDYFELGLVVV